MTRTASEEGGAAQEGQRENDSAYDESKNDEDVNDSEQDEAKQDENKERPLESRILRSPPLGCQPSRAHECKGTEQVDSLSMEPIRIRQSRIEAYRLANLIIELPLANSSVARGKAVNAITAEDINLVSIRIRPRLNDSRCKQGRMRSGFCDSDCSRHFKARVVQAVTN